MSMVAPLARELSTSFIDWSAEVFMEYPFTVSARSYGPLIRGNPDTCIRIDVEMACGEPVQGCVSPLYSATAHANEITSEMVKTKIDVNQFVNRRHIEQSNVLATLISNAESK